MRSKSITRCMILVLALITGMFLMSPGLTFAGVGGSATPTYPVHVEIGETDVPVNITIENKSSVPQNTCNVQFTSVFHTPSCGDFSNLQTCAAPDPGVFSVVNCDGASVAAIGVNGNASCVAAGDPYPCCQAANTGTCDGCGGINFLCTEDATDVPDTGRVIFTRQGGGVVVLGSPNTTTAACILSFA